MEELLRQVIEEARALAIPVSKHISPKVLMNSRAKTRFGRCIKQGKQYTIELSTMLTDPQAIRQTLAHEMLHTCPGCGNHGIRWKRYAAWMNQAYGYRIQRTDSPEAMGTPAPPARYSLRCTACGTSIGRMKRSKLVLHPEYYRCRCGGSLVLETIFSEGLV